MISQPMRPLIEVLAEIEDPRHARGKRYPLVALLALVCVATLCGYRSYSAMAEWGRHYGADLLAALGFTRPSPPSAATLCRVLRGLDGAAFDAAIGAWAEEVLAALPARGGDAVVALDGKTLRGSRKQGLRGSHLLAAVSRRLGLPLAQVAVDDKTNEIGAVQAVLRALVLEGRVFTMDALLTQRAVAQTVVDGGGDYVMVAKENQPGLVQGIAGLLATPAHVPGATPLRHAQTAERGHGRLERRAVPVRAVGVRRLRLAGRPAGLPRRAAARPRDDGGAAYGSDLWRDQPDTAGRLAAAPVAPVVRPLAHREPHPLGARRHLRRGSLPGAQRRSPPGVGHGAAHRDQPAARRGRGQHRRRLSPLRRPTLARSRSRRPAADNEMTLVGQTDGGRYLSVVVAPRGGNMYYVVTARDATREERRQFGRRR